MPKFDLRIEIAGLVLYVVDERGDRVAAFLPDCRSTVSRRQPDNDEHSSPHIGYVRFDARSLGLKVPKASTVSTIPSAEPPKPEFEVVRLFDGEDFLLNLPDGEAIEGLLINDPDDADDELPLPKFDRFADTLELNDDLFATQPAGVLMRMVLKGGAFESMNDGLSCEVATTLHSERTRYTKQLKNAVTWTRELEGDCLTVNVKQFGSDKTIPLELKPVDEGGEKPVVSMMIGNLCSDNPLEWEGFGLPDKRVRIDDDFKWLYRLLHPRAKSYQQALGAKGQLPVPIALQEVPLGGFILCYGARKMGTVPL